MSRGPGRVQSAIIFAFEVEPNFGFTTEDFAQIAFGDGPIGHNEITAVNRALKSPALNRRIKLRVTCRPVRRTGGIQNIYWKAD